jgi:hypothetical protein
MIFVLKRKQELEFHSVLPSDPFLDSVADYVFKEPDFSVLASIAD